MGKQVHDARLAAVCLVHLVDEFITFNTTHFQRLLPAEMGIKLVSPNDYLPPA
jgi:hypothetical protein